MKKTNKNTVGLIRGRSSAFIISLIIHGILFLGAGTFVVFHIIEQKQAEFVPEKIKRPAMPLKKLKVKVKETQKPRKSTERITSTRRSSSMPDISLPAMTSMGKSLEDIGGFQMMANLADMSIMGSEQSVGNDFEGTFYDLKRWRNNEKVVGMTVATGGGNDPEPLNILVREFLDNDWDESILKRYKEGDKKLYATQFFIPPIDADMAPILFGFGDDYEPALWSILYKGKLAHPDGGTFRFSGVGDTLLYVRVNGKLVLDAGYEINAIERYTDWRSPSDEHRVYPMTITRQRVGEWFTLEPGVPVDMEVWYVCRASSRVKIMLTVQEEDVDYPVNDLGDPVWPIFKTMETPQHLIDEITYRMTPGQVELEETPIFSAY
jgi:hypothetical protein